MSPRRLVGFAVLCCLAMVLIAGVHEARAAQRPNVLFLFSDDQQFDTIGALGNPEIRTPNLDRLVRDGTTFTHAAIMGAGQGAVCVPSRAMLMTGRTLFRATATYTGSAISTNAITWPQAFLKHGHDTFAIGKWHNDRASFARSFSGGAALFFGGMTDHSRIAVQEFDPAGKYPKSAEQISDRFSTELFADEAVRFLEARQASSPPFALFVSFTAPHDPRTPPPEFAALYDPQKITVPENFAPEHPFDNGDLKIRDEKLLPWPRTTNDVQREIALYYAMISHLDAGIGRILDALDASPFATNTVVVFAGDNGLAVGRHGLLGKQNLYEHSIRVPLIFAGPGIPKGRRSEALCYLLDVAPTLCDLAGIPAPGTFEGLSLADVIAGRRAKVRDELFAAYRMHQRSVRDERWKLIEYSAPNAKTNVQQLFDLRNDPHERRNLIDDSRHSRQRERLGRRLAALRTDLSDPLATSRPAPRSASASGGPVNPVLAPIVDNPALPRVLLIGDSISLDYTLPARRLLQDIANVHRIPANGASTTNGLAHLESWLGAGRWDVIHFNWGLHDLKLNRDGSNWIPLAEYEANLEKLVAILKRTGARLIWASTTPVPPGRLSPPRRADDVLLYNRAAAAIMKRNGVAIDDLHTAIVDRTGVLQRPANVHFHPTGSEALAKYVADSVGQALRDRKRP